MVHGYSNDNKSWGAQQIFEFRGLCHPSSEMIPETQAFWGVGRGRYIRDWSMWVRWKEKKNGQLVQNLSRWHWKLAGSKSRGHLLEKPRPWRIYWGRFSEGTCTVVTIEILLLCSPRVKGKDPQSSPCRIPRAKHFRSADLPREHFLCVMPTYGSLPGDPGLGQLPGWRTDRQESQAHGEVHSHG